MDFTEHYEGICGGYVEFQITKDHGIDKAEHWREDSLYAPDFVAAAYKIFEDILGDVWFYDFNQIDYTQTMKLIKTLQDAELVEELTTWILGHIKEDTYLNVLGV